MAKKAEIPDIVCVGNVVVDAVGVYVDTIPDEGSLALFDRVSISSKNLNTPSFFPP